MSVVLWMRTWGREGGGLCCTDLHQGQQPQLPAGGGGYLPPHVAVMHKVDRLSVSRSPGRMPARSGMTLLHPQSKLLSRPGDRGGGSGGPSQMRYRGGKQSGCNSCHRCVCGRGRGVSPQPLLCPTGIPVTVLPPPPGPHQSNLQPDPPPPRPMLSKRTCDRACHHQGVPQAHHP